MRGIWKHAIAVIAALATVHCGGASGADGDAAKMSSVQLALTGGDFNGNSVYITATRTQDVDSKYRCDNSAEGCFNLDSNATVTLSGLCPSNSIPNGFWDFTYEVYSDQNCTAGGGELMNTGDWENNFECFDSRDVFTKSNYNQTLGETLDPGGNHNVIACLTTNATKGFSFTSCAVEYEAPYYSVLDCGCAFNGLTCECGNLTNDNLQNDESGKCEIRDLAIVPAGQSAAHECRVVCESLSTN